MFQREDAWLRIWKRNCLRNSRLWWCLSSSIGPPPCRCRVYDSLLIYFAAALPRCWIFVVVVAASVVDSWHNSTCNDDQNNNIVTMCVHTTSVLPCDGGGLVVAGRRQQTDQRKIKIHVDQGSMHKPPRVRPRGKTRYALPSLFLFHL